MTPYRRNIVVGLTMLGALIILAWMIMQFGDRPARLFAPEMYPIRLVTDRADGLAEGSTISYRGVAVGRVATLKRSPDGLTVQVEANIEEVGPPLPANLEGVIRSQVFGGSGILSLQLTGPKPEGELKPNAELHAHFLGIDLLPPEFAELATELRLTSKQFRESNLVAHLDEQVQKVGKILDSVNGIVSDPKTRENIQAALTNVRAASESAARLGQKLEATTGQVNQTLANTNANIDKISRQLSDRLDQIARTMSNLESITAKIDQGKGTAGALVNDPKLYESLVETTQSLNATVSDLKRLVEQWEQEGISFKLGK